MALNITISSDLFADDALDQDVLIRDPITVQRLIAEIKREFSLTGHRYTLRNRDNDRLLYPQKTLEEQGVHEGDVLIFSVGSVACLRAETGEMFFLSPDSNLIGRPDLQKSATSRLDIDLSPFDPAKTSSRPHARITSKQDQYFVESLNEKNLTYLNEQGVPFGKPQPIKNKDILRFGKVKMTFSLVSD